MPQDERKTLMSIRKRKPKSGLCRWSCGVKTTNHSGICDDCWSNRGLLFAERLLKELAAIPNPGRVASGKRLAAARRAKLEPQMLTSNS